MVILLLVSVVFPEAQLTNCSCDHCCTISGLFFVCFLFVCLFVCFLVFLLVCFFEVGMCYTTSGKGGAKFYLQM